jgi:hypothetical protein
MAMQSGLGEEPGPALRRKDRVIEEQADRIIELLERIALALEATVNIETERNQMIQDYIEFQKDMTPLQFSVPITGKAKERD